MSKPSLSPAARDDIRAIRTYGKARFGAIVAVGYIEDLRRAVHAIGDRPLAGRDDGDLGDGVRSVRCRSHRIYYQANDGSVRIVRILHHAQDVEKALGQQQ